jgi:23S rRNA pseudoU1915 N3-methylase RlmH
MGCRDGFGPFGEREPPGRRIVPAMARELIVAWAGRRRRDAWDRLCAGYRERIGRWVPIRELVVKAKAVGEGRERRAAEGQAMLAALPSPCWLVALDRRGRSYSTEELARRLGEVRTDWPHPVAFAIGSDLGLDPAVLERAAPAPLALGPDLPPRARAPAPLRAALPGAFHGRGNPVPSQPL